MANSDEYVINTACVVADYFNHRIEKAGYNWQVSPTRNFNPNNKVTLSMRRLCAEFEKRYKKEFCEMCDTCAKLGLEKDSYLEVLNQLIEGGENGELNWGRVVAIFAFGGQMCVKSMAADKEYEVDYVREWTCAFMKSHVDEWIQRHGGWVCRFLNLFLKRWSRIY